VGGDFLQIEDFVINMKHMKHEKPSNTGNDDPSPFKIKPQPVKPTGCKAKK
jgi:hypothetical protein